LAAVFLAAAPGRAEQDSYERLRSDPSPAVTKRLRNLLQGAKDRDLRFWAVQALGSRLKERGDLEALEGLLAASVDRDADVRGSALRAMTGFAALPKEHLHGASFSRLDSAVRRGRLDNVPSVRGAAEELGQVLERYRAEGPRKEEPAAARPRGPAVWQALGALWALLLSGLMGAWVFIGLPVFDPAAPGGRTAEAAWAAVARHRGFLAGSLLLWLSLAAILAGHGFDLILHLAGHPQGRGPAGWLAAYLAASFCALAPGTVAAARLSAKASRWAVLVRDLPRAALLTAVVSLLLGPAEVLYRLLLRRVRKPAARPRRHAGVADLLEGGAVRSACLASAVMSLEGHGLIPALGRAARIGRHLPPPLGFSIFDSRFTLRFAAPVLAGLCLLVLRALPMDWTAPKPLVLCAGVLWAWAVLAGVLFAVLQALEGAICAAGFLACDGRPLPHPLDALMKHHGRN